MIQYCGTMAMDRFVWVGGELKIDQRHADRRCEKERRIADRRKNAKASG